MFFLVIFIIKIMDTSKPSHKKTPLWIFLWFVSGLVLVPFFKPLFLLYNIISKLIRIHLTKSLEKGDLESVVFEGFQPLRTEDIDAMDDITDDSEDDDLYSSAPRAKK